MATKEEGTSEEKTKLMAAEQEPAKKSEDHKKDGTR